MSMGLQLFGLNQLINTFQAAQDIVEGPTWIVGTNVEYAAYVEFRTSQNKAYPYIRPGTRKAMRKFDQVAARSDDTEELVKNLALEIEKQTKKHMKQVEETTDVDWRPGGHLIDTGKLINSIEAERLR